jgi:hypothetical protein
MSLTGTPFYKDLHFSLYLSAARDIADHRATAEKPRGGAPLQGASAKEALTLHLLISHTDMARLFASRQTGRAVGDRECALADEASSRADLRSGDESMTRAATDGARTYSAVVIGLRVAAGLYHQFIRKDDTLLRMM